MPRTRAHQQALADGPSPGYGQGVALRQAMAAIPLADKNAERDQQVNQGIAAARQRAAKLQAQAPPAPAPGVMDVGAAAAAALPATEGHFNAPTANPGVPVTNGLPSGPGMGPEALGSAQPAAAAAPLWKILAQATGDPYFTDLARRSGLGS